jgi:hypothetical protein
MGFTRTLCQPVSGQGFVQLRVSAEYQGYCLRVGVAHGADDGETSTRVGHVQVREQYVKVFGSDTAERFAYIRHGDYLEPIPFQHCLQHIADNVVVLCQ